MVKLSAIMVRVGPVVLDVAVFEQFAVRMGSTDDVEKLERYWTFGFPRVEKNVPGLPMVPSEYISLEGPKILFLGGKILFGLGI